MLTWGARLVCIVSVTSPSNSADEFSFSRPLAPT